MKISKESILKTFYKFRAKRLLVRRYRIDEATTTMMEKWVTSRILDGQKGRRDELKELRNRLDEIKAFISYLKKA